MHGGTPALRAPAPCSKWRVCGELEVGACVARPRSERGTVAETNKLAIVITTTNRVYKVPDEIGSRSVIR